LAASAASSNKIMTHPAISDVSHVSK